MRLFLGSFGICDKRITGCLVLGLFCVLSSGCGGPAGKVPVASEQAQISGSVLNDGKPLTVDSEVYFFCQDKSAMATGKLDALGKFSLKATDASVGIPGGQYKVEVKPPAKPTMNTSTDDYKKMMQAPAAVKPVESSGDIPAKFQSMETSGLVFEVKPGPNTIDIDFAKLPQ